MDWREGERIMRAERIKSVVAAAGALVLALANLTAPAMAGVWHGGGGFHGGGGWRGGGMHAWHGGGFYGGDHGWHGGWRGYGWGPAIGLGVLGGYVAGSALGYGYGYGAYDYGYNGPYGYGYGECVVNEPLYNAWGVVVGHHAVYVC
jgi:hypothetical protein